MQRKLLTIALTLLVVVGAVSIASATIIDKELTSTLTSQILELSCSADPVNGLTSYNYALTNPLANTVVIGGFTLQFPGVPTDDFVVTQTPLGWTSEIVSVQNKINWKWNLVSPVDQLDPGETFHFAFTSAIPFGGGTTANSSAQNGFGFSGLACGPGPVIPEPMSMMLGLMGLGSVLGVSRLRKR